MHDTVNEVPTRLLLVLSIEKTGGQAVRQSLRAAAETRGLDYKVRHAHFLDPTLFPKRGTDEEKVELKLDREEWISRALRKKSVDTTIFTIRREPVSRFMSAIWHDHHEVLVTEGVKAIFLRSKVRDAADLILRKEAAYRFMFTRSFVCLVIRHSESTWLKAARSMS